MIRHVEADNFCCFEKLDQSLAHQGLVFISGDHRDTSAASSNGAGKSTLFKAITWCLYGETVDEDKGDAVIRRGTKKTSVTTTLADGSMAWYITRTRSKGKPGLVIEWEDGSCPGEGRQPVVGDKKALQDKIVELVGLDFRAFKNTVLYGQNDSFKFADPRTKDGERKDMLHRILRTETLQSCHEVAKIRLKKMKDEMAVVMADIATIDGQVEVVDLPDQRRRHDNWEAERSNRVATQQEQARRNKNEAQRVLRMAADTDELDDRMAELQTAYDCARAAGEDLKPAQARVNDVDSKVHEQERIQHDAEIEAQQFHKQLKRLKGDKCPTCTTPLNEGTAKLHVTHLRQELGHFEGIAAGASTVVGELKEQLVIALKRQRTAQDANADASRIRDKLDAVKDEIHANQRVKDEAQRFIDQARQALERAKVVRDESNPHTEALKKAITKVKGLVEQSKAHEIRRAALDQAMAYTQFWVRGYSPQGLPSFVLDAVMPYLTDQANEYLRVLADGDITMFISTQRELKSQKDAVRDEISIQWDIEGNANVSKSGGQRTKMNLSMDMALMDLAASREGVELDLLLIDEALDGLDKEGTARVLTLLQRLRKHRGSIFVISHSDDMGEMFEKGLTVVREDGVSRIEVMK